MDIIDIALARKNAGSGASISTNQIQDGAVTLEKLDSNIVEQLGSNGGADWNAAEGEDGYIANKPFGVPYVINNIQIEGEFTSGQTIGSDDLLSVDENYEITIGDNKIEDSSWSALIMASGHDQYLYKYIGNPYLMWKDASEPAYVATTSYEQITLEDNGQRFVIYNSKNNEPYSSAAPSDYKFIYVDENGNPLTETSSYLKIETNKDAITKISKDYIPESDWEAQKDETGYIKNKPFGYTRGVIFDGIVTKPDNYYDRTGIDIPVSDQISFEQIVPDTPYKITIDGTEYISNAINTSYSNSNGGLIKIAGHLSVVVNSYVNPEYQGNGEPFTLIWNSPQQQYLTIYPKNLFHDEKTEIRVKVEGCYAMKLLESKFVEDFPTGIQTIVEGSGSISVVIGEGNQASSGSFAQGYQVKATGAQSFAQGNNTTASNWNAHAEGDSTTASGRYSHAEGSGTTSSGYGTHAEGGSTSASGMNAHAEGNNTSASEFAGHAEGSWTTASGQYSHAEGFHVTASGQAQHAGGQYNIIDSTSLEIIGNGTANNARSNARTLDKSGNEWLAGNLTAAGGTVTIGSTAITEAQLQSLLALLNTNSGEEETTNP